MGFPVQVEKEGGVIEVINIVKKLGDGTLIDAEGNAFKRTSNALVFAPIEGQMSFEVNEPADELVMAGQEPVEIEAEAEVIDNGNDIEALNGDELVSLDNEDDLAESA